MASSRRQSEIRNDERPKDDDGGVHLAELGLNVLLGQDGEVLVHDLATECFFSVEMADYVLRILCHVEEFLMQTFKIVQI